MWDFGFRISDFGFWNADFGLGMCNQLVFPVFSIANHISHIPHLSIDADSIIEDKAADYGHE
jgi:hypothetical protein